MEKLDYLEIGQRIRNCRENLGISQEEAAERCGISPSFYSNIERGIKIMSLETFSSICVALAVSSDYLLSGKVPNTDDTILNILSEAKKSGTVQYEKYIHIIKALSLITDKL